MGGAIFSSGTLELFDNSFVSNTGYGGVGGSGGEGGTSAQMQVQENSGRGGPGGTGGAAQGAAVCNLGSAVLVGNCFSANSAQASDGGSGGVARGTFGFGTGGSGADAGNGVGGGVYSAGELFATNNTFYANSSAGGKGGEPGAAYILSGSGRGGDALGGGLAQFPGTGFFTASCVNNTFALNGTAAGLGATNAARPGLPGSNFGGGIANPSGALTLGNTILAANQKGSNYFGLCNDAGGNLSSDSSCPFTDPTSRGNLDPKLSPFQNNGGPTRTLALLFGSPAIDTANSALCPRFDQRGIPRPQGGACDIGAYEAAFVSIQHSSAEQVEISFRGWANQNHVLQKSADLKLWANVATNMSSSDGLVQFAEPALAGNAFYRVRNP